jgi:hypothetical protein
MAVAPNEIMLKNVRLAYPSLFKTEVYNGEDTGKYAGTFILDGKEHKAAHAQALKIIEQLIEDAKLTGKIKSDKICLKKDESDHNNTGGWVVKATNKTRPTVVNTDISPLTEDDNKIYGGCYVNVKIGFWVQNNAYGKRVNANLLGVQFAKDGKAFGEKKVASASDFDAIEPAASFVAEVADEDTPF